MGGGLGTGLEGDGDIHEEVEAGAGLYGIDGRDCRGAVGGVRVEEVGTAYCPGHYSRTWEGAREFDTCKIQFLMQKVL